MRKTTSRDAKRRTCDCAAASIADARRVERRVERLSVIARAMLDWLLDAAKRERSIVAVHHIERMLRIEAELNADEVAEQQRSRVGEPRER